VVVERQFPVHAAPERVLVELRLQEGYRVLTPTVGFGEPPERATRNELAGCLRDHVIVGRRPDTLERGEVTLMPVDLLDGNDVLIE